MALRIISTNGNTGAAIGDLHPDGTLYIARRRDMAAGGRIMAIQQLGTDGTVLRTIKVYAERVDNDLRREFPGVPLEDVDGPLGTGSVQCAPDGSLRVLILPGANAVCAFGYDLIPDACAPFSYQGTWPLTVSATDDEVRRQLGAVFSQLDLAKVQVKTAQKAADQANDAIKDLQKRPAASASPAGLSRADAQQMIDDAGFKKALDAIYDQSVNQKGSPLNNVMQQHVDATAGPLLQRIAALEASVRQLLAVKK